MKCPTGLLEFINADPKPVYIGFGSIVVPDPGIELICRTFHMVLPAQNLQILSKSPLEHSRYINYNLHEQVLLS